MKYTHDCVGTCSRQITFDLIDGKLHDVRFLGGCNGNTKGLCALLEGMNAAEAQKRLAGTLCGSRPTSCPDQLARAISAALA
ncbi:MAG: TIGR03905 family TSCPD domain-containing protein [Clostridium sp.]|nr:TIGR03905 family TSCPD domain-containing protein [Clostridium sp.]